jgi:hypothetical protein
MKDMRILGSVILLILFIVTISGCTSEGSGNSTNTNNNISAGQVVKDIMPSVIQYNGSKGADQDNIPIKGKLLYFDNSYYSSQYGSNMSSVNSYVDNSDDMYVTSKTLAEIAPETLLNSSFDPNTKITIFVVVNQEKEYVGTWQFSSGGTLPGYRHISDVIVAYWPEKTIAGWHRIDGNSPDSETMASENTVEIAGGDNINEWIVSLPREA